MSKRDKRYDNIASLYKSGRVTTLTDIFTTVPKTIVAIDLGKKVSDFNKMLNKPDFKMSELYLLARFCGLTESEVYGLYEDHYLKIKNGKITGDGKKIKPPKRYDR